jgi:hypothetical protein
MLAKTNRVVRVTIETAVVAARRGSKDLVGEETELANGSNTVQARLTVLRTEPS